MAHGERGLNSKKRRQGSQAKVGTGTFGNKLTQSQPSRTRNEYTNHTPLPPKTGVVVNAGGGVGESQVKLIMGDLKKKANKN